MTDQPFCSDSVNPESLYTSTGESVKDSHTLSTPAESKALPLEWLLGPKNQRCPIDRLLARLVQAEAHEDNLFYKQDYRQAAIVVSLADRGNPEPFVASSYACYGIHPDKLWPKLLAKRRAALGPEYSRWYDAAGNLRPDAPKKRSKSVIPATQAKEKA
jgi:hypothetical protein